MSEVDTESQAYQEGLGEGRILAEKFRITEEAEEDED